MLLNQSVKIACDAATVWRFIRDMENYIWWFPFIVQMDSADALPPATPGKRYRETAILPNGAEETINVVVVEADETAMHLAIEADLKPVLPRFDYRVTDLGAGISRFDWTCSGRGTGPMAMLGRQIMPIILRPRLAQALVNLDRILAGPEETVMRSASFFRFGAARAVTRFTDRAARPVPGPGEVLVRMNATSINQIDCQRRKGYGRNAMRARGALRYPVVLGVDVAGEVVALGKGVQGLELGSSVFGAKPPSSSGSFADFVAVKAVHLVPTPPSIGPETAAALPYTFLTAWRALIADGGLSPRRAVGKRVFVQGGAGGVGSMAVQIAKALGAFVATSCLLGQEDIVRSLGADAVYPSGSLPSSEIGQSFDLVVCTASAAEEADLISLLKRSAGARYVTIIHPTLALTDERGLLRGITAARSQLRALNARLKPDGRSARWTLFRPDAAGLRRLAVWARSGAVKPLIDRVFPFEALVEAQERLESGAATGKVVFTFASTKEPFS